MFVTGFFSFSFFLAGGEFNLKSHNFKPQLLEVAPHRVSVVVGLQQSCISLGGGVTPHLNVDDVAAVTCYSHFDLLASIQKQDKKLQEGKKYLLGMKRREAINRTSATAQTNENRFLVVSEKNVQLKSMIRFFRRNTMFNHQGPQ